MSQTNEIVNKTSGMCPECRYIFEESTTAVGRNVKIRKSYAHAAICINCGCFCIYKNGFFDKGKQEDIQKLTPEDKQLVKKTQFLIRQRGLIR